VIITDLSDLNQREESLDVSLLLDIINSPDEQNQGIDAEKVREQACIDLAHNKVLAFAAALDALSTTDKDVL